MGKLYSGGSGLTYSDDDDDDDDDNESLPPKYEVVNLSTKVLKLVC